MEHHINYKKTKLLKIDTDGFDLKIIKGAINFIKITHPIIFFEYDKKLFKEDEFDTFTMLINEGYNRIIFYDNFGNLLLSTLLINFQIISDLTNYSIQNNSRIIYYDVCVFHKDDEDLFESFLKTEKEYYLEKIKEKKLAK